MRTIYVCYFMLDGEPMSARSQAGIGDFTQGFWLDDNNEFTKGGDSVTWVPPGAIRKIAKFQPSLPTLLV